MSFCVNYQMFSRHRDGLGEREIKKFFKKCKKLEIIKEYIEKTTSYRTRSERKRDKIRKNSYFRKNKKRR